MLTVESLTSELGLAVAAGGKVAGEREIRIDVVMRQVHHDVQRGCRFSWRGTLLRHVV